MKRILAAAAAAALVFTGCEKSSSSAETAPSGGVDDNAAQGGGPLGKGERSMSGMAAKATGNAVFADGGTALEGARLPPDAGTVTDGGTLR
ncbi:MAG: hypothetical protein M3Y59_22760 [Myxococcota bacterium]|nr:hypothetical protein [Myxococcota bacterium]